MDKLKILEWYSKKDVQKNLLEIAKNREVVSVFRDGSFGKRPDILTYPSDIINAVENGAISFHCSVERWRNPMKLEPGMLKDQLDELRIGWDILIDPDVEDFEIAKIATLQIIETFKDFGIKSYSIKFTGGKGFHLAIPFESLPEEVNFKLTSKQYPELLEKIIGFLKWYLDDLLREALLELGTTNEIAERIGKKVDEILTDEKLDPFKVISLDIFGSRHLFRMPFAINEKTFLISLPLNEKEIKNFKKEDAKIENVKIKEEFLTVKQKGDAEALIIEALDWAARYKKIERIAKELPSLPRRKVRKISEQFFPPCIKRILEGLNDGRKRSVFILINFLRNVGWKNEEIEKKIYEWNEKNYPPLRESYIRTQLRWHFRQERNLLPPNCDNPIFYQDMNLTQNCDECRKVGDIKNPINYPFILLKKRKSY